MKRIDPTVLKETKYIAIWVIIFSVLMEAVFLIIGKWDYTVILGNLLGAMAAVLNFFLMGLTVQTALTKDEKAAKNTIRVSQIYRTLLLVVIAAVGLLVPCFSGWTTIIPLLFPRIAIAMRPLFDKRS